MNEKHRSYHEYGGRGIAVSEAFLGPDGYDRFLAEVGRRPTSAHMIERRCNDRGYEPGNIYWATPIEQARNKRSNRRLTHDGVTLCLVEWAEKTGIPSELIRARIDRLGWSVEKALTTPPHRKREGAAA